MLRSFGLGIWIGAVYIDRTSALWHMQDRANAGRTKKKRIGFRPIRFF
jgi:hypothetical protein